jgi:hypothetical protein
MNNIRYTLEDNHVNKKLSYDEIKNNVNEQEKNIVNNSDYINDFYSQILLEEQEYDENYTKKQLEMIADYYSISKRKKRKHELIENIVEFENKIEHMEIVEKRKLLWFYIQEIKNDNYLNKFLILD